MKIIAGERKGHNLATPKGQQTRPTLARVRESVFAIITGDVPGSIFCDLFAGAGAMGLEALSRGAAKAIFVEAAREPVACLKSNIEKLRYQDVAIVHTIDAFRFQIPTEAYAPDIIFADPPYQPAIIDKLVERLEGADLKAEALVILQTPAYYKPNVRKHRHLRTEKYGSTAVHFYLVEKEILDQATDSR